jgi:hypothetical protein
VLTTIEVEVDLFGLLPLAGAVAADLDLLVVLAVVLDQELEVIDLVQ